ncbi:glycoside hydrolase family 65 protein [Ruminococcaceae bacterium OttesenSCG-928-D13]|nr:glycoside hydrolase family 65 protein [Ruminococcaceae bacterium OttesenSCG-928-D13]
MTQDWLDACLLEETAPNAATTKACEGAFTQGSGTLHLRGSLEEGLLAAPQNEAYMRLPANVTIEKPRHPRSKCGTYLPGVTGSHPLLREELVNLPNPLWLAPSFEGERYDLDRCDTRNYRRVLDMATGELTRSFRWHTRSGAVLHCRYRRIVSKARPNLIVQTASYTLETGAGRLAVTAGIDADLRTNGYDHFSRVEQSAEAGACQTLVETDTGDTVYLAARMHSPHLAFVPDGPGGKHLAAETVMAPGQTVTLTKLTAINASRDADGGGFEALARLLNGAGEDAEPLFAENAAAWHDLWAGCAVEIEGDTEAQRAINFSVYHLLRCAHSDPRVAVCAKGFSGEAYFGHFFWDTEIYLLPFFLHTRPETAKTLLSFRLLTLPGARKNARAYGYPGARYAWESGVDGTEQCPNWQYADHEVHVTADVVYGIWRYWRATGDEAFLRDSLSVLVETADYWLHRVYPAAPGVWHLNGVMGPDEYICLCNNNAYTNTLVAFALECTLEALHLAGKMGWPLPRGPAADEAWRQKAAAVAAGLARNHRPDGLILQCDGFDDYEEPHFSTTWPDRTKLWGSVVSQEKNYRTKALKQADALMLPFLFPDRYSDASVRKNLDYYLPYTTHDSSLSAVVHSILFTRLGEAGQAYTLFERAMNIDLDFAGGGAAEGVHIANCGGLWQAVVLGFGGMVPAEAGQAPEFHPHLPPHWRALRFRLNLGGTPHLVTIRDGAATLEPCSRDATADGGN